MLGITRRRKDCGTRPGEGGEKWSSRQKRDMDKEPDAKSDRGRREPMLRKDAVGTNELPEEERHEVAHQDEVGPERRARHQVVAGLGEDGAPCCEGRYALFSIILSEADRRQTPPGPYLRR